MSSLDLAGRDRAASQDLGADFDVGEEGINLGLDMGDLDAFGEGETSDLKARRGRESSVARLSLGGIGGIASSSAFDNGLNYDIPEDGLALGLEGFDDMYVLSPTCPWSAKLKRIGQCTDYKTSNVNELDP
jgi:hypothetical protein